MKRRLKSILPLLLIILSAAAAELLLANFAFVLYGGNAEVRNFVPDVDNYYLVEWTDTQFSLGSLGFEANGVSFQTRAKDDPSRSFFTTVGVYVRSGDGEFVEAVSKRIAVGGTETLHFKMQNADVIVLTFGNSEGEFYLSNTVVNPTYSLRFNAVRFIVIALAAALIFALIKGGRGRRIRAEMTEKQAKSLALAVCVAACAVFSCLSVAGADGSSVAYPLEGYIENYNPYVQQFDAFQKGQLHIDVEPEQELLELANPYDPAQRQGIYYLWDRALYNGKYYSYFGVTPILTVYYPFYLVTHSLPSETTVKMIYSLMTALFLPLAVFELAKLTGKKYRRG